jgi:predicted lactoylglutathione lyase
MDHSRRQVECTVPVLPVRELKRSISFYTGTLGFKLDWGGEDGSKICSVSRDGCGFMLSETVTPAGSAWVWIGLEDDSLFAEYRKRGVKVRQGPRNCPWAYEMKFEDPDGNVLWLGTEPRKDAPFYEEKA